MKTGINTNNSSPHNNAAVARIFSVRSASLFAVKRFGKTPFHTALAVCCDPRFVLLNSSSPLLYGSTLAHQPTNVNAENQKSRSKASALFDIFCNNGIKGKVNCRLRQKRATRVVPTTVVVYPFTLVKKGLS